MLNPCALILNHGGVILRTVRHASPRKPLAAQAHASIAPPRMHHGPIRHPQTYGPPAPRPAASCQKAPGSTQGTDMAAAKDLAAGAMTARDAVSASQFGSILYNPNANLAQFDILGGTGQAAARALSAAAIASAGFPTFGFFRLGSATRSTFVAATIAAVVGLTAVPVRDTVAPSVSPFIPTQPGNAPADLLAKIDETTPSGTPASPTPKASPDATIQAAPGVPKPAQEPSNPVVTALTRAMASDTDQRPVTLPVFISPLSAGTSQATSSTTPSTGDAPFRLDTSQIDDTPATLQGIAPGQPGTSTLTDQTAIPEPASLAALAAATAALLVVRRRKGRGPKPGS